MGGNAGEARPERGVDEGELWNGGSMCGGVDWKPGAYWYREDMADV